MLGRRDFLRNTAAVAALAALGIDPSDVLAAEGDTLKVRIAFDIQVLDPGYMIGGADSTLNYACLPRLALPVRNAEGVWGWAPSEFVDHIGEDDPTHISFRLKPGLKWSGGLGTVSAHDVKYSLERMVTSNWAPRFFNLDHVDVVDDLSGVIVLKSASPATFTLGLASDVGSILPKAAMEKLKDQKFSTEFPAQCGPYSMTEWAPKQKIVLKANPEWTGSKPAFPEIHLINIEDSNAAELAFEAGEVAVTSVLSASADRYRTNPPEGSALMDVSSGLYTWMGMNTEYEALKDVRVRKAIQRAIDVPTLVRTVYGSAAPVAHGTVPPGILGHRTESGFSYNPEEAKQLLKEAGVSSLTLELKLLNEPYLLTVAQIVQANLADVGITLDIKPLDSGPFWNLGVQSAGDDWKTSQLWIMRFTSAPDPSDCLQWFTKSQIGIWNWERWSDAEFEQLSAQALSETDAQRRAEKYIRMQDIMENTGAYVWLTFDPLAFLHRKSVIPAFMPAGDYMVERFARS